VWTTTFSHSKVSITFCDPWSSSSSSTVFLRNLDLFTSRTTFRPYASYWCYLDCRNKLIKSCSVDTIRAHNAIDQVCVNKFMRRCRWSERKCSNSPGCSGRRTGSHASAPIQMSSYLTILKIVADRPTVKNIFASLLSALVWLLFNS